MRAASTTLTGLIAPWMAVAILIQPATAQVSQHIDLAADKEGIMFSLEDGEIAIRPVWPAGVSSVPTGIAVKISNYPTAIAIFGDSAWINYRQWVGAIRLESSDPAATVFLETYSAGAHCCSILVAISPEGNSHLTVNEFPSAEGEIRAELPTDIDGDGVLDIVREDEHVCDDDGECASRVAIYNIRRGRLLDVTALPKFQTIIERYQQKFSDK